MKIAHINPDGLYKSPVFSQAVLDEEIRKNIKKYEESLSESERNPNVQKEVERLIECASQPLPSKPEKRRRPDGYIDTHTRSRNTEDTSD